LRHQVRELEMEKHTLERLQPTSRKKWSHRCRTNSNDKTI
jgi:hypothetical protein